MRPISDPLESRIIPGSYGFATRNVLVRSKATLKLGTGQSSSLDGEGKFKINLFTCM